MKEITRKSRGVPLERVVSDLNVYLRGWIGYFGFSCPGPVAARMTFSGLGAGGLTAGDFLLYNIDRMVGRLENETMARRENPVKELRERQIKEASLVLFSEKGYHNTTMTQIADAAELGKGTIYWYWKSKEELAFSLVEEMLADFAHLIESARDGEGAVVERFRGLVAEVARLYERETEYLRLLWKFRVDRSYIFSEDYTRRVASYYLRMRKALEEMIEEGIENKELKKRDPRRMAFIVLGIAEGLELEWLENEDEFSIRDALPEIMDIVIAGLAR